ncbi:MAG: nucleotidyltransferase [Thermoflexales bacterium]|nr:nucleotidyltransferase [Thermoflexales bacterium]
MREALRVLNALKEEGLIKDYAIGGAVAALRWTEPFFTQDLDVFVVVEVTQAELILLNPIYEYFQKRGYVWKGHWIVVEGVPIDIFPADSLETEAVEQAIEVEYEGIRTKVMTPEYLIALFLRAGREKDRVKVKMLLEQSHVDRGRLKEILEQYGLSERFGNIPEDDLNRV